MLPRKWSYVLVHSSGKITVLPVRTASSARSAIAAILRNHCVEIIGSTTLSDRWHLGSVRRCGFVPRAKPFSARAFLTARRAVKRALEEKGLARGSKPHTLTLPRCQRSGGVVEPMISTQWFLKMQTMAEKALEAVHSGKTQIIPAEWVKTYDHFLESIQDWCVSRQLWWGHQIPAWHGPDGKVVVARERPKDLGAEWKQDPDVLDTWFSSALWPFSTQGWPEVTPAL